MTQKEFCLLIPCNIFIKIWHIFLPQTCLTVLNKTFSVLFLSHLQAEQIQWDMSLTYHGVNISADFVYFGSTDPIPWAELNRYNYSDTNNPLPPTFEKYTVLSMKECTNGLLLLLLLHSICMWIAKFNLAIRCDVFGTNSVF